jgi:hypothetical protein
MYSPPKIGGLGGRKSTFARGLLVSWSLVIGYWLLVIGHWLLVVGCHLAAK